MTVVKGMVLHGWLFTLKHAEQGPRLDADAFGWKRTRVSVRDTPWSALVKVPVKARAFDPACGGKAFRESDLTKR